MPDELHAELKEAAWGLRLSLNAYIVDVLKCDLEKLDEVPRPGVDRALKELELDPKVVSPEDCISPHLHRFGDCPKCSYRV